MRELAADLLVGRLVDWGVDTVFCRPGPDDGGVLAAFARFAGRIRLVVVRHEDVAALMASGYAKTTGRVGICLATSGPGALHLLAGLYDAKLDHQPVLAVTESSATELLGTSFAQRLAVDAAYGDVADYNVRVDVPVQIPAVVDIGIGQALAKGTVSHMAVPDDHPLTTGCVGALGTRPSEEALAGADTLLVVGTNFPYARNLPDPDAVRTVQVESDLDRVRAADADAALVGDAAETLDALLPLLGRKPDRDFLASTQAGVARWRARLVELEDGGRDPVRPQYLLRTLDRLAAGDAVLAADSGTVATWAARHFDVPDHRQFLLSANLATAAAGLPYAMAAQWASRGRQTIAVVGSDEFATLMAELRTAVGLGLPVKVVVCNTGPPPGEAGGAPPPPAPPPAAGGGAGHRPRFRQPRRRARAARPGRRRPRRDRQGDRGSGRAGAGAAGRRGRRGRGGGRRRPRRAGAGTDRRVGQQRHDVGVRALLGDRPRRVPAR